MPDFSHPHPGDEHIHRSLHNCSGQSFPGEVQQLGPKVGEIGTFCLGSLIPRELQGPICHPTHQCKQTI